MVQVEIVDEKDVPYASDESSAADSDDDLESVTSDDDERDERGRGRSGARAQAEAAKVSAGQKADNVPKRVVRHVTTKRSRTVQAPKRSTVWALGKPLE